MFRMTPHGHRLSNGGLTDSQLPLDVPGAGMQSRCGNHLRCYTKLADLTTIFFALVALRSRVI